MTRMMWSKLFSLIVAVLVLIGIGGSWLFAAGETKRLTVKADQVVSRKDNGTERVTTYSKGIVTQEDATFTADTIVQHSQNNVHEFTCTGNPVFSDPENRITADKVIAYSTPRRAEFSGNVKMVSTPKKPGKSGSDIKSQMSSDPSTTTCDKLSYDYAGKKAYATGNVMVVQKERTIWADEGTYDQNQELLTLRGNVRMKNTGKEEIKEMKDADTVTVSLENDWIDIMAKPGGKVEMTFEYDDEDKTAPPAKKD